MSFWVTSGWGGSDRDPSEARLNEILDELAESDPEHGEAWLEDEEGRTLSIDLEGRMVLSITEEESRYLTGVSRDEALRSWLLFIRNEFDELKRRPWKNGYGPPISAEELAERKREADAMTLALNRRFYDSFGAEDAGKPCRKPGCSRGSVPFSVYCRPHHFENVNKVPCPFDH